MNAMKQLLRQLHFWSAFTKCKVLTLAGLTYFSMEIKADVPINETNFPNRNFRNSVLRQSYGQDGVLTDDEIADVTDINVSGKGIQSLKGIEYFTALTVLYCDNNQLTELDVSKNSALTLLSCNNNQLTELDVSKNSSLTLLSCDNNQLTEIDVSKNTALTWLLCNNNQMTELDVSKNTALIELSCGGNQLTKLDVSKNSALITLYCGGNQLTKLDVSECTVLIELYCEDNQLKTLDVSGCIVLEYLRCSNNQLITLNISGSTGLTTLTCNDNLLKTLDVSNNTELSDVDCQNNLLTTLDISGCTALKYLYCNNNQLAKLNMSGCTALNALLCYNNQLKGIAMDALVESLPYVSDGTMYVTVVYNTDEWIHTEDNNLMTSTQVEAAKAKGWTIMYEYILYLSNLGINSNMYFEYPGCEPLSIDSIIADKKDKSIYNLSGQRISTPQRGINIIDGTKVLRR